MAAMPAGAASGGWTRRRIEGKLLSIVRLAKASLTYAGGIDYLAWKINRHAGTKIAIKPWQRRWPLIAALTLVPRLVRSGAIRYLASRCPSPGERKTVVVGTSGAVRVAP